MAKNPFTLSFGRVPVEYISRDAEENQVYNMFTELPVTDQIYAILGVRGSGKTVMMTNITKRIAEKKEWIIAKISPLENILESLYKILVHDHLVHEACLDAQIDISIFEVGVSVKRELPEKSLVQAIDDILKTLDKKGSKVLVTIDEVTDTPQMRAFVSAFQLFITNDRPVYFLSTALFESFEGLKNAQNLTFLYRAPKIVLTPLSVAAMAETYRRVFNLTNVQALKMAATTKGYPLAFQILGYTQWEKKEFLSEEVMEDFDLKISDAAYRKLWTELSETDQRVMKAVAEAKTHSVKEIREILDMDPNKFNQYRRRLASRGVIDVQKYGCMTLALPRFEEFIEMSEFYM